MTIQVLQALRRFGLRTTFVRTLEGVYNPDDGKTTESSTRKWEGIGRLGTFSNSQVDGTRIQLQDRLLTFIPDDLTFRPQLSDRVLYGEDSYNVINVVRREKNGQLICFSCQVRNVGSA